MEDFLEFQPDEFQVIETFVFEEDIQRPDNLRLFTLEEQLLDYFNGIIPKGKITRFEMNQLATQVDRVRDAYLSTVEVVETLYDIRKKRQVRMPSWVHPLLDPFEYKSYNYSEEWEPLFFKDKLSSPQFYQQIIRALPRPYRTAQSANPHITRTIDARKEDGMTQVRALGLFDVSKTKLHDDGTQEIYLEQISNTQDDVRVQGYALDSRPLDLPNPLAGHPFFEGTQVSKVITTEAFDEVYPSVDAIFTHAVPTTTKPYTDGMKYLKLYDVQISEVPWSVWKTRFPPEDPIDASPEILSVKFPSRDDTSKPSEKLQSVYTKAWSSGVYPRKWMMEQEDAGKMVLRMLLSKASESGNVPVEVIGEVIQRSFEPTTPEECIVTTTFHDFLESGISRAKMVDNKVQYYCVPIAIAKEERKEEMNRGRIAWKESMEADILKKHQTLLKSFQGEGVGEKRIKYATQQTREESQIRREILVLLSDPRRDENDKAEAIEDILKDIIMTDKLYLDADGSFLLCSHTFAVLKGDMADDVSLFYREWTAIEAGQRVCTTCGERVGDVFITQDEFDNDGKLMVSQGALDTDTFHGEGQMNNFTNSLKDLKKIFDLKNTGEAIIYLLLSLLQVLPTEIQLLSIIQYVRKLSKVLKQTSQKKKFASDVENRIYGIIGLAGTVVLMQTHQPFLVPKRKFGTRKLLLSGYPRDTQNSADKGILDTLIFVLKNTFEAFPQTFRGSVVPFFRAVLNKPAELRDETIRYLSSAAEKDFKAQFVLAKEHYAILPEEEVDKDEAFPLMHMEKTVYSPQETLKFVASLPICFSTKPLITLEAKMGPVVRQKQLELWTNIKPSKSAIPVPSPPEYELSFKTFTNDEIRKSVSLGFPKLSSLKPIEEFLNDPKDGIAILGLVQRVLDILSGDASVDKKIIQEYRSACILIQTKISPALLRDSAKGLAYKLFQEISKNANSRGLETLLQNTVKRDVVMRMILLKKLDAEKEVNTLKSRERETMKSRLREMNDNEREITKKMLDIGIAEFIITNRDREIFVKEYGVKESTDVLAEGIVDGNKPEEGYNDTRDYENDNEPVAENGQPMNVDNGDYGDAAQRDYNDYAGAPQYDDNEGYGF